MNYNNYEKSICGKCGTFSDGNHKAEEHVSCTKCSKVMTLSNSHGHWHGDWFSEA